MKQIIGISLLLLCNTILHAQLKDPATLKEFKLRGKVKSFSEKNYFPANTGTGFLMHESSKGFDKKGYMVSDKGWGIGTSWAIVRHYDKKKFLVGLDYFSEGKGFKKYIQTISMEGYWLW